MPPAPSFAPQCRELKWQEQSPAGHGHYGGAAHGDAAPHLGTAKASQEGKPPVKLLQLPREEEELRLCPKVSRVHSEAPSPSKVLTPAKPFADGGLIQVSPPEPHGPPTHVNYHLVPPLRPTHPPRAHPALGESPRDAGSDAISRMCQGGLCLHSHWPPERWSPGLARP